MARRLGLTLRFLAALYPVAFVGAVTHAGFVLRLDRDFTGTSPSWSGLWNRLPIDVLLVTAIASFVAALRGYRLSREARGLALELQAALDAARRQAGRSPASPARLVVSTGADNAMVEASDVEWFAAAGNYVVVNWKGQEGLIRETLTALAQRLDPAVFARTHRSTIVNLARVRALAPLSNGAWVVTAESGAELVVSRTYRDDVLRRLHDKPTG